MNKNVEGKKNEEVKCASNDKKSTQSGSKSQTSKKSNEKN